MVLEWSRAAKETLTAEPKENQRRLHRLGGCDRRIKAAHDGDVVDEGTLR